MSLRSPSSYLLLQIGLALTRYSQIEVRSPKEALWIWDFVCGINQMSEGGRGGLSPHETLFGIK